MKILLCLAVLLVAAPVYACDHALALSDGCYSELRVERVRAPQYRVREFVRIEREPVYVERQKIVRVEKQRGRRLELRAFVGGRNKVVRRERIVERSY
jgi:hypothetical protein